MGPGFMFYLKFSAEPFAFDVRKYDPIVSLQNEHCVFLANDSHNVKVQETDQEILITIGPPSLQHVRFVWSKLEKKASATMDEMGLANVFFYQSENSIYFFNWIEVLEKSLNNGKLSEESVSFFLQSGFLKPGQTFWRDIDQLIGDGEWDLLKRSARLTKKSWQKYCHTRTGAPDAKEFIHCLKSSLDLIHNEMQPQHLCLSGGLDTRVVSYLWDKPIQALVVHSPWMDAGQDADVNVSKAWAMKRGLDHKVFTPEMKDFGFFMSINNRPSLSGLYGGEFLGGQYLKEMPSRPEGFADWQCMQVFLKSARTSIYKSVVRSWSDPYRFSFKVASPFMTPEFLKLLLAYPQSEFTDYRFYEKVFDELGPEVKSVPLVSMYTQRHPHLAPTVEWGVEPKSLQKRGPLPFPAEELPAHISLLLQEKNISVPRESLSTTTNVLSMFVWLKTKFATSEKKKN